MKREKFYDISGKVMLYGFLVLGIFLFISDLGKRSSIVLSLVSFVFCGVIKWILDDKKIKERVFLFFLVDIGFWLGLLGEMFFYGTLRYYDKALHIFVGVLLAEVLYQYYNEHLKLKKEAVFLSVLGLLALWEIYEYLVSTYLGYPMQGVIINGTWVMSAIDDTMTDLILGSIGAVLFLIFRKEKG